MPRGARGARHHLHKEQGVGLTPLSLTHWVLTTHDSLLQSRLKGSANVHHATAEPPSPFEHSPLSPFQAQAAIVQASRPIVHANLAGVKWLEAHETHPAVCLFPAKANAFQIRERTTVDAFLADGSDVRRI